MKFRQWILWKILLVIIVCVTIFHFIFQDEVPKVVKNVGANILTHFPDTDFSKSIWGVDSSPDTTSSVETPVVEIEEIGPLLLQTTESVEPPIQNSVPFDEHVAICVSVMNQSKDLTEWLVHHYHHMGIARFYIMDDGSDPPLSTFEYPGVPRSALTFTYQERATRHPHMQTIFYSWCLERWNTNHTWMAFIDGDEYLGTPGNETLLEVLASFEGDESIGALGVNWQIHTSSGLLTRPASTRKSFTTCLWDGEGTPNIHIKSIVKTSHAGGAMNPHKFNLRPNTNTVGEHRDIVNTIAFREPITRNRVSIHHYAIGSREQFEEKLQRGNGMSEPKTEGMWDEFENRIAHVNCTEMVGYDP